MHYRTDFQHNRGIAAVVLRELGDRAGHRERAILEDPQVHARRWPDSGDCLEFKSDAGSCVIRRRDRAIVG